MKSSQKQDVFFQLRKRKIIPDYKSLIADIRWRFIKEKHYFQAVGVLSDSRVLSLNYFAACRNLEVEIFVTPKNWREKIHGPFIGHGGL